MPLIPGLVAGTVALLLGLVIWAYDALFVPGDAGPPVALAGLIALLHWFGLVSAVQVSARSRAAAVAFTIVVSPIETLLLLWIRWATNVIELLAVTTIVLACALVLGAVLLQPPRVSGVTPGPGFVEAKREVHPVPVAFAMVIAISMFWWVLMLLEVLVVTDPWIA